MKDFLGATAPTPLLSTLGYAVMRSQRVCAREGNANSMLHGWNGGTAMPLHPWFLAPFLSSCQGHITEEICSPDTKTRRPPRDDQEVETHLLAHKSLQPYLLRHDVAYLVCRRNHYPWHVNKNISTQAHPPSPQRLWLLWPKGPGIVFFMLL